MKKFFLSVIALFAFNCVDAQIKSKGTIEVTPKIGTSSFSESNDDGSTNSNAGVSFGVTADYYFNNRWSLRSGLQFDKMGGKYNFGSDKYEDKLNYVSVPLNANWHFGSTRKWNLNFGLSPSFLTKAQVKFNGLTANIPSEEIKSFQLGFTYGIGYKLEINKKFGILFDAQFFNGLTKVNTSSEDRFINSGYSFNLGGVFQL
jgi:outer membrane receptor for Fe3+-dicitrate